MIFHYIEAENPVKYQDSLVEENKQLMLYLIFYSEENRRKCIWTISTVRDEIPSKDYDK